MAFLDYLTGITLANEQTYGFTYDSAGRRTQVKAGSQVLSSQTYDSRSRVTASTYGNGTALTYTYDSANRVTQVKCDGAVLYQYAYSSYGELGAFTHDGTQTTYHYDLSGRLVSETTTTTSGAFISRISYTYEDGKNRLKALRVETENNGFIEDTFYEYTYGNANWKDQLTGYNGGTITYDAIGNPLTYYDGTVFTWTEGRKLASYSKGDTSITYQYDGNGLRSEKTVNGTATKYRYIGGNLFGEYTGNKSLTYQYDEAGRCIGFAYNNGTASQTYYYLYNLQGDVIAIFDTSGSCVAKYSYDAWGKIVAITDGSGTDVSENASHIANVNPLRYKGYYYDAETGFGVTGTRYYDLETGRFVNADGYVSTGKGILSYNMYVYCGNNPVNRIDPTGMLWESIKEFFSEAWVGVKSWAKNTFGAGFTTVSTMEIRNKIIGEPMPIVVETGTIYTNIITQKGDSSKPVSAYAQLDTLHPLKNSLAGAKLNIGKCTLQGSVGIDDLGISVAWTSENNTYNLGIKTSLAEFKFGIEGSSTIQWDNEMQTNYTNVSVSGWWILFAYAVITTGQMVPQPAMSY